MVVALGDHTIKMQHLQVRTIWRFSVRQKNGQVPTETSGKAEPPARLGHHFNRHIPIGISKGLQLEALVDRNDVFDVPHRDRWTEAKSSQHYLYLLPGDRCSGIANDNQFGNLRR